MTPLGGQQLLSVVNEAGLQELFAMGRAAWRKQGIVVIRIADVRHEWARQALVNGATLLYGQREVS